MLGVWGGQMYPLAQPCGVTVASKSPRQPGHMTLTDLESHTITSSIPWPEEVRRTSKTVSLTARAGV